MITQAGQLVLEAQRRLEPRVSGNRPLPRRVPARSGGPLITLRVAGVRGFGTRELGVAGTTFRARWAQLGLVGTCLLAITAGPVEAKTLRVKPVDRSRAALVFEIKGLHPKAIRGAYLRVAGKQRRLSTRRVQRAARRGRLRVRLGRKLRRSIRALERRGRRPRPRLIIKLARRGSAKAPNAPPPRDVVVVAAGDIACAGVCGQDETAALIAGVNPDAVLGLGDYQYEEGSLPALASYYHPYWGAFKSRTYAINGGSHDYYGTGDYLAYFGTGGPVPLQPEGSYSFDLGAWHMIALNSYCFDRTTCDEAAWTNWLRADLAAHPSRCTLAFWHQPYWTSPSHHAPSTFLRPWVDTLYAAGADVILQAHNHGYERFLPQRPDGVLDHARGITAFTAGTGGSSHYSFGGVAPNSAVRNDDTFGVLKLTLRAASFDWQFLPEPGKGFTDLGSAACH
jgi:hypothetical protein